MSSILGLFRKRLGTCHYCGRAIRRGEYYGVERGSSSLSIAATSETFFCKACIEDHAYSGAITEASVGQTHIITGPSGDRYRITIER